MTLLYNKASQKEIRRKLRRNEPDTERLLWSRLRGKQLKGYKFRRQYSISKYILDFYCPQARLAVEVDGDSHYNPDAVKKDGQRQKFIEDCKIRVIRFTNQEVTGNLEGILETIVNNLPPLTPPYKGGE